MPICRVDLLWFSVLSAFAGLNPSSQTVEHLGLRLRVPACPHTGLKIGVEDRIVNRVEDRYDPIEPSWWQSSVFFAPSLTTMTRIDVVMS